MLLECRVLLKLVAREHPSSAKEEVMSQTWSPTVGEVVRVKSTGERGPIVNVEGSGESAVYAVNCRTYRYVDLDGQIKNTALEPLRCPITDLEPDS